MKPTTGYAQPKRLARPKKQVRLNLRRGKTKPEPSGEIELEPKNTFWKWVAIVALLHVAVVAFVTLYYEMTPTPPPPVEMISLLPAGEVVKGTPAPVEAPKLGPTTPAPSVVHHHAEPPPPAPTPVAVKPTPAPVPTPTPTPIIKSDKPSLVQDKPTPPKPVTPPKPKVKVDLTLADGPTPVVKPTVKPKPHVKKAAPTPVTAADDSSDKDTPDNPDSQGLSKEQIAQKLGAKLKAASGTENATNHGTSGSAHSQANPFQDFYLSVRDQVMSKWTSPNLNDETAVNPEVTIHVEKDGRVPPEGVTLTRSSGNQAYDESAVAAAKSLGYLLQPLPDGCPPDIHINFKLTR